MNFLLFLPDIMHIWINQLIISTLKLIANIAEIISVNLH